MSVPCALENNMYNVVIEYTVYKFWWGQVGQQCSDIPYLY